MEINSLCIGKDVPKQRASDFDSLKNYFCNTLRIWQI